MWMVSGREGEHWQKKRVKTTRERTQRPLKENSLGGDPGTSEDRSHQVERWRVQEKRKEEKWKKRKKKKKKKVKYRKVKWWRKCEELIISLLLMEMKKGQK